MFLSLLLAAATPLTANGGPTVPTNVKATNYCSSVGLTWSPSVASQGATLRGYKIYRNGSCIFTNGTTTPFSDLNLVWTVNYTYTVSAYDSKGNESAQSSPVSVVPCPDVTQPAPPATLTPVVAGCNQVNVSWTLAADVPGQKYEVVSGVKSYQVFRNGTSPVNQIAVVQDPVNSYTDNNAPANSAVYYAMQAIDNSNNVSGFQLSGTVTTPACPPGAPTGLAASAASCNQVSLSWNAPASSGSGLAGHNLYRNGTLVLQVAITSAPASTVAPSTSYSHTVTAVDTGGRESTPSATASVTTPACSSAAAPVSNLGMSISGDTAVLHWPGTPGTFYQARCASGFSGPCVAVDAPTTNLTVTSVATKPPASYRVGLFTNSSTYPANSNVNRKDKAPPTVPSGVTASWRQSSFEEIRSNPARPSLNRNAGSISPISLQNRAPFEH